MLARTENISIKSIADGVGKSGALQRAEIALATALNAKQEHLEALRRVIGENGNHSRDKDVIAMSEKEKHFASAVYAARAAILPLRQDHANNIKLVIEPHRTAAAEAIIELLVEIKPHLDTLTEGMLAIERAGGETVRIPPGLLTDLEIAVRRIAR